MKLSCLLTSNQCSEEGTKTEFFHPCKQEGGFPGSSLVKDLPANAGDTGSNLGSEGCPGGGNGYPLHYFCLLNSMNRGAWQATVHGVSKKWTQLGIHTHTHTHTHTQTHYHLGICELPELIMLSRNNCEIPLTVLFVLKAL